MSDDNSARFARERLRELGKQFPTIASALGVQGTEVPLGFTIKAYADQLDEQIVVLQRRDYVPGLMGSAGDVLPKPDLTLLKERRLNLAPFRHWAREHERYNTTLRRTIRDGATKLIADQLRKSPNIQIQYGPLARPNLGQDWPLTRINAYVRLGVHTVFHEQPVETASDLVRYGYPEFDAVETSPGVGGHAAGGRPRPTNRTRIEEEWISFLYINWNEQTISTKAPPREKERDVWYWIGLASETFLLAVDAVTLVGLLRRAVISLTARLARTATARALIRESLNREIKLLADTAQDAARARPRGTRASSASKPPIESVGRSGPYASDSAATAANRQTGSRGLGGRHQEESRHGTRPAEDRNPYRSVEEEDWVTSRTRHRGRDGKGPGGGKTGRRRYVPSPKSSKPKGSTPRAKKKHDAGPPKPGETGLQYERRILAATPLQRRSPTYLGWKGGRSGSMSSLVDTLENYGRKYGVSDLSLRGADRELAKSVANFIGDNKKLLREWTYVHGQRRQNLQRTINELQNHIRRAGGDRKLRAALDSRQRALQEELDEIHALASRKMGNLRPDLVEVFPGTRSIEVYDITKIPGGTPAHNFKTKLYVEFLRKVTGWRNVTGFEWRTSTQIKRI